MIVGAIDFGTTYSGWAFSFVHEFRANPRKVTTKSWLSGAGLATEKAPTCVLIGSDGHTLIAFGYDAETKYSEIVDRKEQEDYYFFKEFKMALNKKIRETFDRNITIEDVLSRSLPAMKIFSLTIRFLIDDMLSVVNNRTEGTFTLTDIHVVLTVPAIWTDAAKQFMTEAALQAGVSEKKLSIALEPEAASVFCRYLPVEAHTAQDTVTSITELTPETKYMVVDAGGGTLDITVHEVDRSGGLREVHAAEGGGWGGTMVNHAFEQFMQDLVTKDVYDHFIREETNDWLDICQDFELKKRDIRPAENKLITIRLPLSLLQMIDDRTNQSLAERIQTDYSKEITLNREKLRMRSSFVRGMFTEVVKRTVGHIGTLLNDDRVRDVTVLLLVGGFSDSPVLQHAVKSAFPHLHVVIPQDAATVVLKGAVIYGHDPDSINARALKYTYGYRTSETFNELVHPEANKIKTDQGVECKNVFHVYAYRNDIVTLGTPPDVKILKPQYAYQMEMTVPIFATQSIPPVVIDRSLSRIGELTFVLDEHDGDIDREIEFSMNFQRTTVTAVAKDKRTDRHYSCNLNFLG